MKLVLQCAMCGTHHPVGTVACSTCRATGVTQLRLMFECQTCGRLDLNPMCDTCPRPASANDPFTLDLDDDLIVAEEITDDPFALDPGAKDGLDDLTLEFDIEDEEYEKLVVDKSEDEDDGDSDLDSDFDDLDDPFEDELEDDDSDDFDAFDDEEDEEDDEEVEEDY